MSIRVVFQRKIVSRIYLIIKCLVFDTKSLKDFTQTDNIYSIIFILSFKTPYQIFNRSTQLFEFDNLNNNFLF